jgi:FKBP-type peptidyl-prolyl cis-trans isomerase FkpA
MNNLKTVRLLTLLSMVLVILTIACEEDSESKKEKEKRLLEEFLITNNITMEPTASGLYYIETRTGTGAQPQTGEYVSVHYTGRLIDSTLFDTSVGEDPLTFPLGLGYVIPGWDEGIALMKKGGEATLIIPSWLAYGSKGAGDVIPPYSTLLFDVELLLPDY